MSEEPCEASKDDADRESFATWLSLFGVTPSGAPVPAKPAPPKKRPRSDRAASTDEGSAPA